jgi:YD repeat-containing protein
VEEPSTASIGDIAAFSSRICFTSKSGPPGVYEYTAWLYADARLDKQKGAWMRRIGVLAAILLAALSSAGRAGSLPEIAAGQAGSYLIKRDGSLWAWGDYNAGQNAGTPAAEKENTHTVPATVAGLSDVVAVSAGSGHSVALKKKDGTVWTWGYNGEGQLGTRVAADSRFPKPEQVSGLSDIKAIVAGDRYCMALKSDGTVWSWGNNWHGQLGDGTKNSSSSPSQVAGLSDIAALAAGMGHALAVKKDGTVWAWGYNDDGELGDGKRKDRFTPFQIPGLSGVKAIAAGSHHSVALKNDGTVWMWGGQNKADRSLTPRRLAGLSQIVAISAGGWYSLALKDDGTVWAWGVIANGEQDDDTMNEVIRKPVQIKGLTNVAGIAAGLWHALALKKDGTVWGWGRNYFGALGDGTETSRHLPVRASVDATAP